MHGQKNIKLPEVCLTDVCMSCDAGYLYDKNGQKGNNWSSLMSLMLVENGHCFEKQYEREELFLSVSSLYFL